MNPVNVSPSLALSHIVANLIARCRTQHVDRYRRDLDIPTGYRDRRDGGTGRKGAAGEGEAGSIGWARGRRVITEFRTNMAGVIVRRPVIHINIMHTINLELRVL